MPVIATIANRPLLISAFNARSFLTGSESEPSRP
eukprot:CAMPEP_0178409042 /NCGR_PEP_ID=MMETSP0689_2-20121128/20255_1 /TAXON_ID=160604 /ORGANISM="Amphidinium massartii, Strain CS-259" /LENGTH=33 /DNA_ID= /DNA_START= /DNA_END= /DNA_ORIENTATION=